MITYILTELPNISKGLCAELENYRFEHDQTRRRACSSSLRSVIDRPPQFLHDTFPRTMYARVHVCVRARVGGCARIHAYVQRRSATRGTVARAR